MKASIGLNCLRLKCGYEINMWQTNVWQQDVIRHTVEAVRTKDSRAVLGHLLAAVDKYFREIQHTVAEGQGAAGPLQVSPN